MEPTGCVWCKLEGLLLVWFQVSHLILGLAAGFCSHNMLGDPAWLTFGPKGVRWGRFQSSVQTWLCCVTPIWIFWNILRCSDHEFIWPYGAPNFSQTLRGIPESRLNMKLSYLETIHDFNRKCLAANFGIVCRCGESVPASSQIRFPTWTTLSEALADTVKLQQISTSHKNVPKVYSRWRNNLTAGADLSGKHCTPHSGNQMEKHWLHISLKCCSLLFRFFGVIFVFTGVPICHYCLI